ncbi:FimV/HubP family polar landmark protein [Stenotrophomonas sp. MMGLT7]|uniref:type IV pilus assembly protein FimV n=1 Tax=Stenotrophomonas sp. MMGLT7 TaxID=2901227 RepID=UPI001E3B85D6|nr:FimV/HubP family polar landmark protein [Stenotrophomonas sp. MMGLT7]MCD7098670.1 ferrous iron transporter B [Stenotrophomonas sp. MMGLT7]
MKSRYRGMARPFKAIALLGLVLASGVASALGLGDIRVLSRPGQPLLAEIPVISNEPGELDDVRVALASAETFARVGLERPQGLVDDLHFALGQDSQGRAVIRVTSTVPVDAPSLSFLIEVDWGQGRLVREYSALVDAPNAAVAAAAPQLQSPRPVPADAIGRPRPLAEAAPEATPAPSSSPAASAPGPVAAAALQTERPQSGDALAPVRAGETLSHIAARMSRDSSYSLNQTMLALLRANPEAFIGGNVNRLRAGAILRTPAQDELARVGAAEATAMVREQTAQWRQARAAIPQPAEAGVASAPAAAGNAANTPADARLEIAPAVAADGDNAATTSGTAAGGEGDMAANEELRQAREDLATRDAELQELRARVGELEKLQQQQQALVAMKDSELAAAQKRLAETSDASATPAWLWGGVVLVVAGIAAWLLARRRKPSPLPPLPREYDASALAAAVPAMDRAVDAPELPALDEREEQAAADEDIAAEPAPAWMARDEPSVDTAGHAADTTAVADGNATGPDWNPQPAPADAGASIAPLNPAPAGRERLELAVAYMDLGDNETARSLLQEVAASGDPQARVEAIELLNRLG